MVFTMKWKHRKLDLKGWTFGELDGGYLEHAINRVLQERLAVIFGPNGVRPQIYCIPSENGLPQINIVIDGAKKGEAMAEINLPFKDVLNEIVDSARGDSDTSEPQLKRLLEKALADLSKK